MSTTIDSLSIQIETQAGNSAQKIEALAKALERLKATAGLTKVVNNLNKVSAALNGLNNATSNMSGLNKLTTAMNGLASMQKLSGLSNAVNTLKKIPGVVDDLDDVKLEKFRIQMQKLADALAPLATKINDVARGFAKLPSQVSKAVTATNKMGKATKNMSGSLDTANLNLWSVMENMETMIGHINTLIQGVSSVLSQAMEWDGIQFRFGRAFGEDAEEVYQYILKINDVLGINIQEFMQYSSLYGSLLSGFGMAQEKVTAISVGLTELSYDIWAAYNDRFKSLEQASEAVRSAITGEIEPIRNAGIALTEASLQEFIDSTHLAGVSIEKLTEAQKAEVRYAAMVNAAMNQGIVGTYAREMQTAEGAVRSLSQSYKSLIQALGSLFIPLLQIVVPYVTAFVEVLTEALFSLAALLGIDIQKIDWSASTNGVGNLADGAADAATGLGSAADAAKKLKNYTLGFDELNVISPDSGSGGSGGSGAGGGSGWGAGLDLGTLWDDSVFAQASKQVDELKVKVKAFLSEWKEELLIIGAALSTLSVTKLLSGLGGVLGLGEKFLGVMSGIRKFAQSAIIVTLQFTFMGQAFESFMGEDGDIWDFIEAALIGAGSTWVLYKQWGPAGLVVGLGVTAVASLKTVVENGGVTDIESATVGLTGLASAAGAVAVAWKWLSGTDLGAFIKLVAGGAPFFETLGAWFPKLAAIATKTGAVISSVWGAISGAVTAVASALGISVGWVVVIIAAVAAAIAAVIIYWDEIKLFFTKTLPEWWDIFVNWLSDIGSAIGEYFSEAWLKVKDLWSAAATWFNQKVVQPIVKFFEPIVGWFKEWFSSIWQTVSDVFYNIGVVAGGCWQIVKRVWEIVAGWFDSAVVEPVAGFFSWLWSGVSDLAILAWGNIKTAFSAISGWINDKVVQPVSKFFSNLWSGFLDKAKDAWAGVKLVFGTVAGFFRDTFEKAWRGIVSVFSVAGEIFVDIKDGIVTAFKSIVNALIRGINKVVSLPFDGINSALGFIRDIEILGISPFTNIREISVPEIPLLAGGGFVSSGQMFIAREAGPELVGNIRGKTAVANNDQIVSAVSQGVYQAVVAAMGGTTQNGEQNVNVYLDGKQIYASVKKTEAQRGVSLMGNQLGYSY